MITSSPSPTLHSRVSTSQNAYHSSRTSASNRASGSTASMTRPSSLSDHSPSSSNVRSSHTSKPQTADASTQYSPPNTDSPASSTRNGKRKEREVSPSMQPQADQNAVDQLTKTFLNTETSVAVASEHSSPTDVASSADPTTSSQKRHRGGDLEPKMMPFNYQECEISDLVEIIAAMLMELVRYNDPRPLQDGRLTRFHSRAPPTISVIDYLQRLATHATLSQPILLSMVYYIDRLCASYPAFHISSLTVHRFLITSATVASKGLSDSFWTNRVYSRVGGVSVKELALLELEFLWRIEWRIVPKPEILVDYYRNLVARSPGHQLPPVTAENEIEANETDGGAMEGQAPSSAA